MQSSGLALVPGVDPLLSLADQRSALARFSRWLSRLGFMPGTAGNLSTRIDANRILATPTGCSKALLKPADMVLVDVDGKHLAGSRNVTSEIGMHLVIYRMRTDVNAVVHAHPPIATGFACAGRALDQPLCAEAVMALGPVPLAPYATTGTDQLAASLRPLIPNHNAILMANHGAVTYAETLLNAFLKMETLEHFAHISLVAEQLGSPRLLEDHSIGQLLDAKTKYLRNSR